MRDDAVGSECGSANVNIGPSGAEIGEDVNADVLAASCSDAERLGSIERVNAQRHGAIRVGTPEELARVTQIFGACASPQTSVE